MILQVLGLHFFSVMKACAWRRAIFAVSFIGLRLLYFFTEAPWLWCRSVDFCEGACDLVLFLVRFGAEGEAVAGLYIDGTH